MQICVLTEIGRTIGLIPEERYERFLIKKSAIEEEKKRLSKVIIKPSDELQVMLKEKGAAELKEAASAQHLLKRPELTYSDIARFAPSETDISADVAEQVDIQTKYEGYIGKQLQQVERMRKMENKKIPENLDYYAISGLATEAKQKLLKVKPLSVGQASRVSGVNPSDISILLVYLEQGKLAKVAES